MKTIQKTENVCFCTCLQCKRMQLLHLRIYNDSKRRRTVSGLVLLLQLHILQSMVSSSFYFWSVFDLIFNGSFSFNWLICTLLRSPRSRYHLKSIVCGTERRTVARYIFSIFLFLFFFHSLFSNKRFKILSTSWHIAQLNTCIQCLVELFYS